MDIPSHYQRAFFEAIRQRDDVDLVVRYFHNRCLNRSMEGWQTEMVISSFERCLDGLSAPSEMLDTVPDWRKRIHLSCRSFNPDLIDLFCQENVKWCHWSEMPGIKLSEKLGFRGRLFQLVRPFYHAMKRAEGQIIAKSALGAFGQGVLAKKAFQGIGVPKYKCADLFYAPNALDDSTEPAEEIIQFLQGRRAFLSVGALCKRKGTDILIKAFADIDDADWCLVLCGLDKTDGKYQKMAERVGVDDDRILFLGTYPSSGIAEVFMACDVFVLPTRFDGWGVVLNEAASVGMPLIATDMCGAAWHIVEDGVNGYRVRTESVTGLAWAMKSYTEQPDMVKEHGAYSRDLFFREFTPEKNAQKLVFALQKWLRV
jgi:glycosyltransferase involved in cell wall biosynthesis